MNLNSILFPAPKCSYSYDLLQGELIFIPRWKKAPTLHRTQTDKSHYTHHRIATQSTPSHYHSFSQKQSLTNINNKKHNATTLTTLYSPKKVIVNGASFIENGQTVTRFAANYKVNRPPISKSFVDKSGSNFVSFNRNDDHHSRLESFALHNLNDNSLSRDSMCGSPKGLASPLSKYESPKKRSAREKTKGEDSFTVEDEVEEPKTVSLNKEFRFIKGSNKAQKNFFGKKYVTGNLSSRKSTPPNTEETKNSSASSGSKKKRFSLDRNESESQVNTYLFEEDPLLTHSDLAHMSSPKSMSSYTMQNVNQHARNPFVGYSENHFHLMTEEKEIFSLDQRVHSNGSLREVGTPSFNHVNTLRSIDCYIPCLFLTPKEPSRKILIYFHGNGEDIHLAYDLLSHIRNTMQVNVLGVEYPGYGMYQGTSSDTGILEDSEALYDFLVTKLRIDPQDLILFGRSIGSGPAAYLASRKPVGALVLMSAFTSIRAVVKDLAGKWATYLIKERFNNLDCISKVMCPTFFVHGLRDSLIPFKHSQDLHGNCKAPCELILPKSMDHVEFDFFNDFTTPLMLFLNRCGISLNDGKKGIQLPLNLYELPQQRYFQASTVE
jgi:pimeloyl-ACP methyl ester carboxylesterase